MSDVDVSELLIQLSLVLNLQGTSSQFILPLFFPFLFFFPWVPLVCASIPLKRNAHSFLMIFIFRLGVLLGERWLNSCQGPNMLCRSHHLIPVMQQVPVE